MISERWKVFAITFLTYALVHSARTSWSSLKYALNSPPYAFEPLYLGTLDMVVLIVLAISLNIFGPMIEQLGAKEFLMKGLVFLAVLLTLLGLLLLMEVENGWPYSIIYPLIGVGSCVGWPACIFVYHFVCRSSPNISKKDWHFHCGLVARSLGILLHWSSAICSWKKVT
jgi:sugar phosphate permease